MAGEVLRPCTTPFPAPAPCPALPQPPRCCASPTFTLHRDEPRHLTPHPPCTPPSAAPPDPPLPASASLRNSWRVLLAALMIPEPAELLMNVLTQNLKVLSSFLGIPGKRANYGNTLFIFHRVIGSARVVLGAGVPGALVRRRRECFLTHLPIVMYGGGVPGRRGWAGAAGRRGCRRSPPLVRREWRWRPWQETGRASVRGRRGAERWALLRRAPPGRQQVLYCQQRGLTLRPPTRGGTPMTVGKRGPEPGSEKAKHGGQAVRQK